MNNNLSSPKDFEAIFLVSIAHASSHFYHLVIPSLFPWLMPAFDLNFIQAGALMTTFFVTSAVGQSASGYFVDKTGPKAGMYLGLVLLASSAIVLGLSVNYAMLFLAAALAGAGNSVFHPADYSLMNYNISKPMLGHAFAWHTFTGNIGWAICPLFMVLIAEHYGWRAAAFAASSIAIIVLIVELARSSVFANDQRNDKSVDKKASSGNAFSFLSEKAVWQCFFFFFFTAGAFGVLQSFSQTIFNHLYNLDLKSASTALTAYLVCSGVGCLLGGFFTNQEKLSNGAVVAIALSFSSLMSLLLASCILTGYWAILFMGAMGLGTGIASPSRDIMIRKATINKLGMKSIGRVYGFTYCGMDVGQSLSPVVFSPLLDAQMFMAALFGVAILQTLAIFTALSVDSGQKSSLDLAT